MSSISLIDTGKKFCYEKLYVLTKGQKHIAECTVFIHYNDNKRNIDFSYIKLCCDVSVAECVDTIVEYARDNKYRLIEYPLLKLYNDGTFFSDNLEIDHSDDYDDVEIEDESDEDYQDVVKTRRNNNPSAAFNISQYVLQTYENTNRIQVKHGSCIYATYQILPNTISYRKRWSSRVSMSIRKYEDEVNIDNADTSSNACIYQHRKSIDVWHYKGKNYTKLVDTINIDFLTSLVLVLDKFTNSCDIHVAFNIDGVQLICGNKSKRYQYRLNKWSKYSDIETYNIAFGYQGIESIKIKVINSLCFPGGDIDADYIDYTSQVYNDLLDFTSNDFLDLTSFKTKRPRQYVARRKSVVKQNINNTVDTNITMSQTTTSSNSIHQHTEVVDDNSLGYIYLLREREFLKNKENVYKVGRTIQKETSLILDRLKAYKKGSELVMIRQVPCLNTIQIETSIVREFRNHFTQHLDGREYFIGNVKQMINIINDICNQEL